MFPVSPTEESQQANGVMQLYKNSDKELPSLVSFFPISSENTHFGQERLDTVRQARPYHGTRGLPRLS
jgi:hypothetical protein